ncbi:MAG TPA: hypothetical protein VIV11_15730 [Kofleriaceae bacterium]
MLPRHRTLIVVWAVIFAASAVGWFGQVAALAIVPFFGAMIAAVITFRMVDRSADLRYARVYYVLVGLLLLSSALATIACGSTLFVSRTAPLIVVGFTALGATNLLIVMLAWRALVKPSTRRAALAGTVAVCAECFAMVFDVTVNMHVRGFGEQPMAGVALLAALGSIATGALACFAALLAFGPDLPDVPTARVVDHK